jgi:cellobiose phosphorylase
MQYGIFDDEHREYLITQPDTPLPWINYLGCEDYFGLISNTAGGYSFYRDARLRRVTRYRYNNVPLDSGGRYIYLRDNESEVYWSPTWQPTRRPLEAYTCRHGLGYTTIESRKAGISAWLRYFVPLGDSLEIWQVRLSNLRPQPARLSIFAAVEFCLWDALDDSANFQRNFSTGEVEVEDGVIYHKTEYRERRDHFAYLACSEPLASYDTQREAFLGAYRGWEQPLAVERGHGSNSHAHGWAPVGAQQVDLLLQPGETRQVIYLLGYHENLPDEKFDPPASQRINKRGVLQIIRHYLQPQAAEDAFQALRQHWTSLLENFQVATPDLHTDRMVNIWNAYQCMITFNLSRSASYFESGVGRGMGFRDSNQDLLGFVHMAAQRARQRLLDLAATQLPSGGAYHQYQPLTRRGNHDIGGDFNDDPLWLVLSVIAYLKETGDFSILEQQVPYDGQVELAQPLYEHLQRSLEYTLDRLGPHHLPLIGRADWNDCLNLNCFSETPGQSFQTTTSKDGKVAESVFIAGLFVLAAKEMAALAQQLGNEADAARFAAATCQMEQAVLVHGWDGEWFRRAYDDFGQPVGSAACQEGQVFIEPQGMCIMAGIGLENGFARRALDSVQQRLATPHGILLQQPAYTRYYLHLGEISTYPPGYKENAGIFCHTNPWIMIAEAIAGNGDRAHDYYLRTNPSARQPISDTHRCEPYVYAQMIAGRDASTHGEAKNSWLTGAAAWNFVAITQWILGIRPSWHGLQIAPAIPTAWPGFQAVRRFRDVTYRITVRRAGPGSAIALTVDGQPIVGDVVPLPPTGQDEVIVEASLS